MFCYILVAAAVDKFFYSRFTFKLSFFFRVFSTWKWLVSYGNHATVSNITISNWFENFLVSNSIYPKSTILGLSFLDPKGICLPNQFSRRSWQKRSVSPYLPWCQRRNWVASMIELTPIFNPSHVCNDMNIFWPASFVKFPWRCRTEFSHHGKT